jgi:hypothetical protein
MSELVLERLELAGLISKIEDWLLNSPVQLGRGPEKGGIAGWLNAHHLPEYVYMEITGYYLSSMAFIATNTNSTHNQSLALERAEKSLNWLYSYSSKGELPPTRKYLYPQAEEDWRNKATFAFDLGMVIRGLSAVQPFLASSKHSEVLAFFLERLGEFIEQDYSLNAYLFATPGTRLPHKWSTTHGPYHLKVVAGVLGLPGELVSKDLHLSVEQVYTNWQKYSELEELCEDLHPTLYYLEGLVAFALQDYEAGLWAKIAKLFETLMSYQGLDHTLPANPATARNQVRADVLAQALRIGCILKSQGYLEGLDWEHQLSGLYENLLGFMGAEGAISFHPLTEQYPQHWNAWCTMFTHQALSFYNRINQGGLIPQENLRVLI